MADLFPANGNELQEAIDDAVAGDRILLAQGGYYHPANYTLIILKNKGFIEPGGEIVIETDFTGSPIPKPQPGYRVCNWRDDPIIPLLAQLQSKQISSYQNEPAVEAAPAANGYILRLLRFLPSWAGRGYMISIGYNSAAQTEYSQIPYNITIDQCVFTGHRTKGQKNAITTQGNNVKIINNFITDCNIHETVGNDATPITGVNFEGPLLIDNNKIVGGTEAWIFGGADPQIRTATTVKTTPAPTTSVIYVNSTAKLTVGQHVAFMVSGGNDRRYGNVQSFDPATGRITLVNAVDIVPDVPGDIRWGISAKNITITRNVFEWDPVWKLPIIRAAGLPTSEILPTGGTIPAGQWYYSVQAVAANQGNADQDLFSAYSQHPVTIAAGNRVKLDWEASTEDIGTVTHYRVYRYQLGGTSGTTAINIAFYETTALTFTDTGAAPAGTSFAKASYFNLKNLGEVKSGENYNIKRNIFRHHWHGSDTGYALWMKVNNQSGNHEFNLVNNITFEWNLLHDVDGWWSYSGRRSGSEHPRDLPIAPTNIIVRNNLLYDSGPNQTHGNPNHYAITHGGGLIYGLYDHNTVIHHGSGICSLGGSSYTKGTLVDHHFTNNIFRRQTYGIRDAGLGKGSGQPAIDAWCRDTPSSSPSYEFSKNIIAGGVLWNGSAGHHGYPADNFFPNYTAFENQFKNYAGGLNGDFRLKRISEGDDIDSDYINAGTDGKDLGCDINQLMIELTGVELGLPSGAPEPDPDPDPEPEPTGIIQEHIVDFVPTTVGTQRLIFSFQPKLVIFFINLNLGNTESPYGTFGLGAATGPTERWAEYIATVPGGGTNNGAARNNDLCVLAADRYGVRVLQIDYVSTESDGCTLNIIQANPNFRIFALGIGGDGITGVKVGSFQSRTTNGTQDVNIGLNNIKALIFSSLFNGGSNPGVGNNSMSGFVGFASEALEQAVSAWYIKEAATANIADSNQFSDHCIAQEGDTTSLLKAKLDAIIAGGFRLNYTLTHGSADWIHYIAISGPRVKVSSFDSPTTDIPQSISVGFKPEISLLMTMGLGSVNSHQGGARFGLGFTTDEKNVSIWFGYDETDEQIASGQDDTASLVVYDEANPGPSAQALKAVQSQFTADTLELNWVNSAPAPLKIHHMSLGAGVTGNPSLLAGGGEIQFTGIGDIYTEIHLAAVGEITFNGIGALEIAQAIFRSLIEIFNLRVTLDVKREVDSGGPIDILATDVGGTVIEFSKAFKRVESINVTILSTTIKSVIYDFDHSEENPTEFKALAFDINGNRVDATISWIARGIV